MERIVTVKEVMQEYGLSRRKADEIFGLCNQLPRRPRGKKRVLQSELIKVMRGEE